MHIDELKRLYADKQHGYFFSPGAMRFFNSRVLPTVVVRDSDYFFVTSEQFVDSNYHAEPRKYTIRRMNKENGDIDTYPTHDNFQTYASARQAWAAINRFIKEGVI